jgi:hypothetical protein
VLVVLFGCDRSFVCLSTLPDPNVKNGIWEKNNRLIELDLFFVLLDGFFHFVFHSSESTSVGPVHFFLGFLLFGEGVVDS